MIDTSLIVSIIHQHRILAFEGESQAPVTAHIHRPMALQIAAQRMQPPAGRVHVFWSPGIVQRKELLAESFRMLGLNAGLRACFKELLDALVPEAFYHGV